MKKLLAITVSIGAFLLLNSRCTKEVGMLPPKKTIDCDTITYSKHIAPIMTASCISCHENGNATNNVNLSYYGGVEIVRANGMLENVIFKGQPAFMPYGQPPYLNDADKAKIRCWIDNGGKK